MLDIREQIAVAFFVACISAGISHSATRHYYQWQAIKHGAAEYDSQSGNWKWIDCAKEQPHAKEH